MCARYTLTAEEKELIKQQGYTLRGEYQPDPNIAITDAGFVVTSDEPDVVQRMHFGIVPADAASKNVDFSSFNIRSEEVLDKPTFEPLLRQRKTCLVFADGFYETEKLGDDKRPWRFVTERKIFAFAGLWSEWIDENGEPYRTYAIFTCRANRTVGEIHEKGRMPVILHKFEEKTWLNKKLSIDELLSLCVPYPDNKMNRYRVGKKALAVSTKARPNKGMELLEEVKDDPRQENLFGDEVAKVKPREEKPVAPKKKKTKSGRPLPPENDLFNSQ